MAKKFESATTAPGHVEEVLEAIGDPYARDVLAAVCREQQSAKSLADQLNQSQQTIYRRLDLLQEHDLIAAKTQIESDGNHHQVFESNFDSVLISVEEDEYTVRIYKRDDLPDRFTNLWDELSRG